jgi:hypothetical protein
MYLPRDLSRTLSMEVCTVRKLFILFLFFALTSVATSQCSAQLVTDYYAYSGSQSNVTVDPVHANGGRISAGTFFTQKLVLSVNGVVTLDGGVTTLDPYYAFQNSAGAISPPLYTNYLSFDVNGGTPKSVADNDRFIEGVGFVNGVPPAYQPGHSYPKLVFDIGGSPTNGVQVFFSAKDPDGIASNNNGALNLQVQGANQVSLNTPEPSSAVLFTALLAVGGVTWSRRTRRKTS